MFQAIKITSVKAQLPYEYYSLPFCKPKGGIVYKAENLGKHNLLNKGKQRLRWLTKMTMIHNINNVMTALS